MSSKKRRIELLSLSKVIKAVEESGSRKVLESRLMKSSSKEVHSIMKVNNGMMERKKKKKLKIVESQIS